MEGEGDPAGATSGYRPIPTGTEVAERVTRWWTCRCRTGLHLRYRNQGFAPRAVGIASA